MQRYRVITLVDITRTNVDRVESDQRRIHQQSNFNSLIQTIGLRSNIDWDNDPEKCQGRFPIPFDGRGAYWSWEFSSERDQVFERDDDACGLLKDDLFGVPIIAGLENTAELDPSAFISRGDDINIYVKII